MQIRLEKDVAVAIKRLAKKEGRSVPKQVSVMLRRAIAIKATASSKISSEEIQSIINRHTMAPMI
jgi:hypothetical protein